MESLIVPPSDGISVSDFVSHLIEQQVFDTFQRTIPTPGPQIPDDGVEAADNFISSITTREKICIVGAGVAGLYTAMILDSMQVDYDILEAGDRFGGRLYTHRFNGEDGINAPVGDPARYDYVDMGAMRFPETTEMARVFDLFKRVDIRKGNGGLLVPYIFKAPSTFQKYNGVLYNTADPKTEDIFRVSERNGGAVPDYFVHKGARQVLVESLQVFADAFKQSFKKGWHTLSAKANYSVRGYLLECAKLPEPVVEWLETFESGTGLYDAGLVDAVMHAITFGVLSPEKGCDADEVADIDWFCIDGGSDHIARRMHERLMHKPQLSIRVTKIAQGPLSGIMQVTFVGPGA